jgi:hypothetical protein
MPGRRDCQINANRFQSPGEDGFSGRAELAPLGECGGAVMLEIAAGEEMAFLVEVVMDGRVDGYEFLQTFICRKRSMALSRRRNGSCEFSARLFSQRLFSWDFAFPGSFVAAIMLFADRVPVKSPRSRRLRASGLSWSVGRPHGCVTDFFLSPML